MNYRKILKATLLLLLMLSLGMTIRSDHSSYPSYFYILLIVVAIISAVGLLIMSIISSINGGDD